MQILQTQLLRATFILACIVVVTACSSSSHTRSSVSPKIDHVLAVAEDLLGTSYCAAGATPECFDCSGFVYYCYLDLGVELPRTARAMYEQGRRIERGSLVPGDLVFFRTNGSSISHVGIMFNSTSFIHSSTSRGVMVSPLTDAYWAPRYVGACRVSN
ncbi:MAG TPA: C40 family peptidase [Candidatus Didemnitutus sp.]|nr:C40 family peptidase [Candidatus Didemnitutus sp.]